MEHREVKTPEQIAELKLRSPGGYRNLRESVINELPDTLFMTPTAVEGDGGAVGEQKKIDKGHYVMLRDQVKDLVEDELLRTPSVVDSTGGAISETQARERGRMVKVADQIAELAAENGLQVSDSIAKSLLPTPTAVDDNTVAQSELDANDPKHRLKVAAQVLARDNGLQVSENPIHSLLPTPRAQEPGSTSAGYGDSLNDVANRLIHGFANKDLLPTPAVGHIRNHDEPIENYLQRRQDFTDGKTKGMPGASLGVAVRMEMLPTPTTRDFKDGQAEHVRDGVVQTDTVARAVFNSGEVKGTNWGKFTAAISRWEALTRPAPAPTKPDGKDGNHRLSAEFTEWMMGVPAGWITDPEIGLKRNEQLKACGNGVVPQQAELALKILLQDIELKGN